MENCVLDWLEKSASLYPDKTAYTSLENSITFSEVMDKAKRIGSAIAKTSSSNTPIAVILDKEVSTISALPAICSPLR